MPHERLNFAGDFGGLAALGLTSADLLFDPGQRPSGIRVLEQEGGRARFSFPLPGTPDALGRLGARPRGLGTGQVWLTVYRDPPWAEVLRARCSAPRSASLAEREWNLLCHLRSQGVGTPEPLLVGARGAGFAARSSFLLVRELEGALPLPRWLRPEGLGGEGPERERGLRALGLALAKLACSGVLLPRLAPEHLWITPASGAGCEQEACSGPEKNRLPGVCLVEVRGAQLARTAPEDWAARLADFLALLELAGNEVRELRARACSEPAVAAAF